MIGDEETPSQATWIDRYLYLPTLVRWQQTKQIGRMGNGQNEWAMQPTHAWLCTRSPKKEVRIFRLDTTTLGDLTMPGHTQATRATAENGLTA